jgi:hypothetical protein
MTPQAKAQATVQRENEWNNMWSENTAQCAGEMSGTKKTNISVGFFCGG